MNSLLKRFSKGLEHAFSLESDIEPDVIKNDLDEYAQKIHSRGLDIPAVMMLEMIRPFNFVLSQVMHGFSPLFSLFGHEKKLSSMASLLESRDSIKEMISVLESKQHINRDNL
ncbi:MAG: hypothetical protein JXR91_16250 [Deltaproteobacteria bacterium]|nr:hypothetical protein [Deltaproteobacteria bacterium]